MQYKTNTPPPHLFVLIIIISFAAMCSIFVSPTLPAIANQFKIQNNEVQNIATYFVIGYLLGQLIYAPLIKGFGVKKALNFGVVICFIGTIACYLSYFFNTFELLKYGRLITGVGSGVGFVTIYSTINNIYYEADARKITSYTSLSFVLVPGIAMVLSGVIVTHIGWQYCFLFLSLWSYFIYALGKNLPETMPTAKLEKINMKSLLTNYYQVMSKKILVYGLMYGVAASAFYIYVATGPLIIISNLNKSAEYYATSNLIVIFGYVLGGIYSIRTSHKESAHSILLGCVIMSISSVVLSIAHQLNYFNTPILFFIIFAAIYFSVPMLFSNISVLLLSNSTEKSTVSSILGFLHLVPPLFFLKIMGTSTQPSALLPLILCMMSITLMLLNVISRKMKKA